MRIFIFALCTLVSGIGLLSSAMQLMAAIEKIISTGSIDWFLTLSGSVGAFAWIAYFRMGIAWIREVRLGWLWPSLGTIAGVLALNGGGAAFFHEGYSPWIMFALALYTFPAIILAIWMAGYHVRKDHNLPLDAGASRRSA